MDINKTGNDNENRKKLKISHESYKTIHSRLTKIPTTSSLQKRFIKTIKSLIKTSLDLEPKSSQEEALADCEELINKKMVENSQLKYQVINNVRSVMNSDLYLCNDQLKEFIEKKEEKIELDFVKKGVQDSESNFGENGGEELVNNLKRADDFLKKVEGLPERKEGVMEKYRNHFKRTGNK